MLGSITPLGERGRGRRWMSTTAPFVASSSIAGAFVGGALGAAGTPLGGAVRPAARLGALAAIVAIGIAVDRGVLGASLPSPRRQVNEEWLATYRGWVVGVGFGAQLGAAIVTVVTSSATYAALAGALLSGRVAAGAAIGGAFGLTRGAALLLVARVTTPDALSTVHRALRRFDRPAASLALTAQAAIATGAVAVAISAR